MSYILNALKKSQQERDRGAVPTLGQLPDAAPSNGRRHWPYWVGGGVAVNLLALAAIVWWLGAGSEEPRQADLTAGERETAALEDATPPGLAAAPDVERRSDGSGSARPPRAPASAATAASAPSLAEAEGLPRLETASVADDLAAMRPVDPMPVDPMSSETAAQVSERAGRPHLRPLSEASGREAALVPGTPSLQSPIETDAGAAPEEIENADLAEASPSAAPPTASPVAPRSLEVIPAAAPLRRESSPAAAAADRVAAPQSPGRETLSGPDLQLASLPQDEAAALEGAPSQPQPAAYATADLPTVRELSYSVQSALPEFPISVHVYSEEAGNRFVIIDREKYREGDHINRDLTLEAIAPGGIVLRYLDTAFCVPTAIGKSCS